MAAEVGGRAGRASLVPDRTHGQLTCDQARERAMQILSVVARGQDPQSDRLAAREAPTLSDILEPVEHRAFAAQKGEFRHRRQSEGP